MKQNDIILKIFKEEYEEFDDIYVEAYWRIKPDYIVDFQVVQEFPSLELLALEDEGDGYMEYYGDLSQEELADELKHMGFLVETIEL